MRYSSLCSILFSCILAVMLVSGCDKSSAPPAPISMEELPLALDKAFAKAKPETKDIAAQIGVSLKAQDYSKAYVGLQTLLGMSGLSKEQGSILTRGMLSVNNALQAAQSKGDQKAAATLQSHRMTK